MGVHHALGWGGTEMVSRRRAHHGRRGGVHQFPQPLTTYYQPHIIDVKLFTTPSCFLVVACAGNEEQALLLVDVGAAFDVKDQSGNTPLLWSATKGMDTLLSKLLVVGAKVDEKDRHGRCQCPLPHAA